MSYQEFLDGKAQRTEMHGFDPIEIPDFLFDFQKDLVTWALEKGRAAIFADCGLGKTPMELVWADNVAKHTAGKVLILAPLAVSQQIVREGVKFGIEVKRSSDGQPAGDITVTNYEKLEKFNPEDYQGVVCDESSILKNFSGKRRTMVTEFMRTRPFRLLATATAAPNDWIELGTSSESLGEMGYMDMLSKFFKNDQNSNHPNRNWAGGSKWRFRGHAERDFWRWVCSWARAIRSPSDMGYDDDKFRLPELVTREHIVQTAFRLPGQLFAMPAVSLAEQRIERKNTIRERCEQVAELVDHSEPVVCWCHLNDESATLAKIIPGAVEVIGGESDTRKEEAFEGFSNGEIRVLVTKPKIAGFGLNWQHCAHQTLFPSHSFEMYYQSVRRSWRFGQTKNVIVDVVTSEGEAEVLKNLKRKQEAAGIMFGRLVEQMMSELKIEKKNIFTNDTEVPSWL